jgi:hypothetical protein
MPPPAPYPNSLISPSKSLIQALHYLGCFLEFSPIFNTLLRVLLNYGTKNS